MGGQRWRGLVPWWGANWSRAEHRTTGKREQQPGLWLAGSDSGGGDGGRAHQTPSAAGVRGQVVAAGGGPAEQCSWTAAALPGRPLRTRLKQASQQQQEQVRLD